MFIRNGEVLGSVLHRAVPKAAAEKMPAAAAPQKTPSPAERPDGVHAVGGGWHEVVVDGEVIDKIRGADAAREAYESLTEQGSETPQEDNDDGHDNSPA